MPLDNSAMICRAYSLFNVSKAIDDADRRRFSGVATTPTMDRVHDTIDPMGAKYANPLALLRNHDSDMPIGKVKFAKPTANDIEFDAEIPVIKEPGLLKDRLDMAWGEIKSGIVNAVSIGFRALKYAFKDDGGIEFQEIEIFELSTVAIPANAEALITSVKSIDAELRRKAGKPEPALPTRPNTHTSPAASGKRAHVSVRLDNTPGVTGNAKGNSQEGEDMKTISEQIAAFEAKRASTVQSMTALSQKSIDEGRNMTETEQQEFDGFSDVVDAIDNDIKRLKRLETIQAKSATPAGQSRTVDTPPAAGHNNPPGPIVDVKTPDKLAPGIEYARLVKVKMAAKLNGEPPLIMAQRMYGPNSSVVGIITKANEVVAGTTLSGNWAADLISAEGAAVAAFLEFLRPATILGKFGTGNVPSLAMLDFYSPYVTQTGGGDAYWVGEGKPKPLTAFDFDRSTLTPLKIANIAVLTEENIKHSSPNSDTIVRNALVQAIAAGLDVAFVDPANAGSANVKPASITNGAEAIAASGTGDADDIRLDVRSLMQKFIDANNAPTNGAYIMSASTALALSLMVNALGQPEFSGISMMGGVFMGLPVIVSQHIGNVVALVAADQIFLGDEGGVQVDMSREASLEMRSAGLGMDGTAGTATAASVSMFQTNMVALRAERSINWKRARLSAVAYLTGVAWGGGVNAS